MAQTQSILDTALAKAPSDAQSRFTVAISDSLAGRATAVDAVFNPGERSVEAGTLEFSSAPILQSDILLPVVVDGRPILLPLDATAIVGRGLASAVNLVPSLGGRCRRETKSSDVERAYELYLRGQGLLASNEKQRVEAAATLLGRALDIDPVSPLEKNSGSLDATLAFARALNNGGMAEVALPLTRAVLQVDPTNPTALKLLIWNHLMVDDYPSALEVARLYLPAYPQDSNTRWAVALAHLGGGDFNEAIHTAQDAVTADPDDVTIWNLLGYLHRLGGDEAAAQDSWSTALEHAAARVGTGTRRNPRMQAWLANIEACVGHTEQARAKVARLYAPSA